MMTQRSRSPLQKCPTDSTNQQPAPTARPRHQRSPPPPRQRCRRAVAARRPSMRSRPLPAPTGWMNRCNSAQRTSAHGTLPALSPQLTLRWLRNARRRTTDHRHHLRASPRPLLRLRRPRVPVRRCSPATILDLNRASTTQYRLPSADTPNVSSLLECARRAIRTHRTMSAAASARRCSTSIRQLSRSSNRRLPSSACPTVPRTRSPATWSLDGTQRRTRRVSTAPASSRCRRRRRCREPISVSQSTGGASWSPIADRAPAPHS